MFGILEQNAPQPLHSATYEVSLLGKVTKSRLFLRIPEWRLGIQKHYGYIVTLYKIDVYV